MNRPTVVFLGGHLCTPALWSAQCQALADVAHCLPMELKGGSTMAVLAQRVLEQSPDRFCLVGLSMGGHVAMEIMRQAPERVERLALVDTRADMDSPERMAIRERDAQLIRESGFEALATELPARWMSAEHAAQENLRELVLNMVRSVSDTTREEQLSALLSRVDSRPSLREIRCPTLIMCGRQDTPNPVWMHEEMATLIPGSVLKVIENCGHLSPIEQAEVVTEALRHWLA